MISFREIGKGKSVIERVFGLMKFVPIMNFDSYNEVSADIACSYSHVARACKMEATEELKGGGGGAGRQQMKTCFVMLGCPLPMILLVHCSF